MAGRIKSMIDSIMQQRANGNPVVEGATKVKLVLKGVNPDRFTFTSPDDPEVIAKLKVIAGELGVRI